MRRTLWAAIRVLPITMGLWSLGCGVTGRQLNDSLSFSLIQSIVQSISSVIQASIVNSANA